MSLPELQAMFADAIFGRSQAALRHIGGGTFQPAQRLQIYRNNVFATLAGALADIYPVVRRLVGEGFFEFAADGYIRAYPPASGNLHDFGAAFPDFIRSFDPARQLAYLGDVARLEWAWHRAFHAADATTLSTEVLARVYPREYPSLRFALHPSAFLVKSAYPLLRIWQVNQPDYPHEPVVDLGEGRADLLVIRRGSTVQIEALTRGEFVLLEAFFENRTLEQAVVSALAVQPDFDLHGALKKHVTRRTIIDFAIQP